MNISLLRLAHAAAVLAFCLCIAGVLRGDEVPLELDSVERDYSRELAPVPPKSTAEALKAFQVKAPFRVELVAAEPDVMDPIAMAFDEYGRLFVVEMRGYSEHPQEQLGRIRMLQDHDRDGRFEVASDFVTGLSWPTAIACYDGGVIVGCPPDILYCKDTDGNGKADEQTTWFTGFGRQNVQGMMNSLAWGLDGRLYGTSSSNGGEIQSLLSDANPLQLRRRDFAIRFRPDIAVSAVSGGGQHGQSFDRWGNRYVSSNSNHIQWVEWEERYQSRNPYLSARAPTRNIAVEGPAAEVYRSSPIESWREIRTRLRVKGMVGGPVEGGGRAAGYFTGASGVTIYTGDAYPDDFQKRTHAFVGDVGGNLVHHKIIEDVGLSKVARRVERDSEFLRSTDTWFRPVQFANGPDGCLYVLDMYRQTIEHPLSLPPMIKRHLDLNQGRDRGRIYRITPSALPHRARQLPGEAVDTKALIPMLGHANGWHRDTAQRLLLSNDIDDPPAQIVSQLVKYAVATNSSQGLVRSLYCLAAFDALDSNLVLRPLGHASWWVRQQGIRLAERFLQHESVRAALFDLVEDPDERVRYQLALTLGEFPAARPIETYLAGLARTTDSAKLHQAILSSCHGRWQSMTKLLLQDRSQRGDQSQDRLIKEMLRQLAKSDQDVVPALAQIWKLRDPSRYHLAAVLLRGTGLHAKELVSFLDERAASTASAGLPDAEEVIALLVRQASTRVLADEQPLARRIDSADDLRLAEFGAVETVLSSLLHPRQPDSLRARAVEIVGSYDDPQAARLLLQAEASLGPSARRRVYDLLCSRASWAVELIRAVEVGDVFGSSITALHRQRLLTYRDSRVRARAEEVFGDTANTREQVVEAFRGVLRASGDVTRGRAVFGKLCAACHRLDGVGHQVGPDLQPLRNRGAAFMLSNILDPNREVDERFIGYTIVDRDGRTYSGILVGQSEQTISVRLIEGKTVAISRDEIDELQATGKSLMPEGLEKDLNTDTLADLIAYLVSG